MATYELQDKVALDTKNSMYTIVVKFKSKDEPEVVFEQAVVLPNSDTEEKAQEYADEYETLYNEAKE